MIRVLREKKSGGVGGLPFECKMEPWRPYLMAGQDAYSRACRSPILPHADLDAFCSTGEIA